MKDLKYLPNHPDISGWKDRHRAAIQTRHPIAKAISTIFTPRAKKE